MHELPQQRKRIMLALARAGHVDHVNDAVVATQKGHEACVGVVVLGGFRHLLVRSRERLFTLVEDVVV